MPNSITFENIISNRILDNNNWRDMTQEERMTALEQIKTFLLSTCRKNSDTYKAITRMSLDNLPPSIGIYRRLDTKGYTAGQDYPSELAYIKRKITYFCY
jgi:hypothetical protein